MGLMLFGVDLVVSYFCLLFYLGKNRIRTNVARIKATQIA